MKSFKALLVVAAFACGTLLADAPKDKCGCKPKPVAAAKPAQQQPRK